MDSNRDLEIEPIPECPADIIQASDKNELAIFIGAGVSRLIGCKGWKDLASDLVRACVFEECISYHQMDRILQFDAKKIISICKNLLMHKGRMNAYYDAINMSLQQDTYLARKFPVYKRLVELKALFVTTNMDTHFDSEFVSGKVFMPSMLQKGVLSQQSLYHIHGSTTDPESMIFTTEQYLTRYRDPEYIAFLNELFATHTVLFIGYGLSELEILDYLFVKARSKRTNHLLLGLYSNQADQLGFEEAYYRGFGIEVHPFQLDNLGHHQLYNVIDSWCKKLKSSSSVYTAGFNFIDQFSDSFNFKDVPHVLQWLRTDPAFEEHFFKTVTAVEWFQPLLQEGYFEPSKNLPPEPSEKEGYYQVPNWRALAYLVAISTKITETEHRDDGEEIMSIIRRNSISMRAKQFNPITAWRFVEIMARIPVALIGTDDFELLKEYLSNEWSDSLIPSEIAQGLFPRFARFGSVQQVISLWSVVVGQIPKDPDNEHSMKVPIMDEHWLEQLIQLNLDTLCDRCPEEAWIVLYTLINDITHRYEHSFDYLMIRNLNQLSFQHDYQTAIVIAARSLLTATVRKNIRKGAPLLRRLLFSSHSIFRRLAIVVLTEHWSSKTLQKLFWSYTTPEVLSDQHTEPEILQLFCKHFKVFDSAQQSKIVKWVNDGPIWKHDVDNDSVDGWKLRWVNHLKEYSDDALRLFNEIQDRLKERHPEWFVAHPRVQTEPKQWQVADILTLSIPSLVDTLLIHEQNGGRMPNEFYNDSLTNALFAAVKQDPEQFLDTWERLVAVPNPFLLILIKGLSAVVADNRLLPMESAVQFCGGIVDKLSKGLPSQETHFFLESLVPELLELLAKLMAPNQTVYTIENLNNVEDVLRSIGQLIERCGKLSKGSIAESNFIRAWLEYSLRSGRDLLSTGNVHWSPAVRDMMTSLVSGEMSLEGWTQVSQYLPQLAWLDMDWVKTNLNRLFPVDDTETWNASMNGYLYCRVHQEMYIMLNTNGIYAQALKFPQDVTWRQRLIHHIGSAYLAGWDPLSEAGSLTQKCIDLWIEKDLHDLINFFWVVANRIQVNKEEFSTIPERVRDFWRVVHYQMSIPDSKFPPYAAVCQELTLLVHFFDVIDSEMQTWLIYAINRMEHASGLFVSQLNRMCETNPNSIGSIYLAMVKRLLPDYDKTDIRSIVEKLFLHDETDLAVQICNTYFANGIEFLKDVFNKYYPKS